MSSSVVRYRTFAYGIVLFSATALLLVLHINENTIDFDDRLVAITVAGLASDAHTSNNLARHDLDEDRKLHDVNRFRDRIQRPGVPKTGSTEKRRLDQQSTAASLAPNRYKQIDDPSPKASTALNLPVPDLTALAVIHSPKEEIERKRGYSRYQFNALISDRIGDRRFINDTRAQLCPKQVYPVDLPKVSIIICYYNELASALIRMVNSILDRTPLSLIEEIIVIDDMSAYEDENVKVQIYHDAHWKQTGLVRLNRTQRQEGLIRARVYGAHQAKGEVLVYLDSHCEVNVDWLQPLLARIRENPKKVVCPIIDIIDADTFKYVEVPVCYGGFTWALFFKWDYPDWSRLRTPEDYVRPLRSPTMAGGLFAMRKDYFHELGEYDTGMDVWGAENVEMSFRIWMCGGELEIIPCSRVGHVFRKRRPYGSNDDSMAKNSVRTARVWMDQYLEKFYAEHPDYRTMDVGSIDERLEIRKRLQCQSFQWYLENVNPSMLPANTGVVEPAPKIRSAATRQTPRSGVILRNEGTNMCLYNPRQPPVAGEFVQMRECGDATRVAKHMLWDHTENEEIRLTDTRLCLDISDNNDNVHLLKCVYEGDGDTQKWRRYGTNQLLAPTRGLCLMARRTNANTVPVVSVNICADTVDQKWHFE